MQDERKFRALIVDDERLARVRIRELLHGHPAFESIDECSNGHEAVARILSSPIDLVFLDIQMPEVDGFDVIELVGRDRMPSVVFVTAYDQFAVRAFEVHAVDYLLKPFDRDRFQSAVDRALQNILADKSPINQTSYRKLLSHVRKTRPVLERVLIESAGHVTILRTEQIDWAESAGNYVKIHAGKEQYLLRKTMKEFIEELPPDHFVRTHRTVVVNIEKIKEIQPYFHGDAIAILHSGARIKVSRSRRKRLDQALKGI